ncbi:MAG: hypothetical protein K9N09_04235 [Candidatus Cloacimonetes bacterium]|nr:hypothetical protein [Candidatus Cloacimonadota bacterium]MCF7867888.1 hypothetical protein [Candidatus Cloacimonadota bacterium]MCF7883707.1 hypothetical protein [Candidatus Cloacimonadota bacterium]
MKSVKTRFIIFLLCVTLVGITYGDEALEAIQRAKANYQAGNLSEAINELNYAVNQIQQQQLEKYKTIFPAALKGWQADEFNSDNAAMAMMGGGLSISRNYEKELAEGQDDYYYENSSIDISIVSDSPLISSIMMMFSNPMFLGGNKMVTIQGEKAIESKSEEGIPNELQFVIENRVIITVSAQNCSKDELYAYANKIDFAKLKSFLKN